MLRLRTSSDPVRANGFLQRILLSMLSVFVCAGAPGVVRAQAGITQDEALRLAFPPPTEIERHTAFLTEDQQEEALSLAGPGVEISQSLVTYYVGQGRDGAPVGAAYFDAHRVRTLREVVMIVVTAAGTIERIEVLKFSEPPEYRAPAGWMAQLEGMELTDDLSLKRDIANMTGATLTARAVVRAARRVLALHHVIHPFGNDNR